MNICIHEKEYIEKLAKLRLLKAANSRILTLESKDKCHSIQQCSSTISELRSIKVRNNHEYKLDDNCAVYIFPYEKNPYEIIDLDRQEELITNYI